MPRIIKIVNGNIITPYRVINGGTIVLTDGIITAVSEENIDIDAVEIDARGNFVAPGFIDLHVHGGGGFDFMDNTAEAFREIARTHARYGTTAMYPTTLTSEKEDLLTTLSIFEQVKDEEPVGAQLLGMHLEGPYFAIEQRGAQDTRYIRNPDPKEYKEIIKYSSCIKRWSAAPELPGAIEFGRYVKKHGILPAIAHTDAIYEDVELAHENGYTLVTHLYSSMSGVTRRNAFRYAGVIESAFLIDGLDVEIIADGIHLPAALLKLVYKIKGPENIALITDAMRAVGLPEGPSILGNLKNGLEVIIEDGVAKLPDRSAFAGSVATADRLVRNMVQMADVPLIDAVRMMTATPARIMGIDDKKGSLVIGKDADIVIFDSDINIQKTIIKGKIIFDKDTPANNLVGLDSQTVFGN
ncbi:N-acetylglucosamine-6-phosphate deacetylase [Mucilaginibacter boryungensis]|uniref:N-acetylglucosamine-6-phosphate deacetylase n=1 Tax=Mucilaginibacter boryungensis TaxID=768480 RepID=A0ABR9XDM2_9SPHI|nr:N-acetylglucosamine-6-phosphate deacetylase [Mucilaginibacter boryungensis]MBE9665492.1 N-acetylglucosamine-6-phosphate deacetylase [Mucilaginibacter boryungensis]